MREKYNYIPIPEWDGQHWQPVDVSGDHPGITWPAGVDPETFPKPQYALGQIVRFRWDRGEVWEGEIRRISLRGGAYGPGYSWPQELSDVIRERYYDPSGMTYTIYAHGHARWVWPKDIIG